MIIIGRKCLIFQTKHDQIKLENTGHGDVQNRTIFLIFAPWPFASACAVSIKAREASYARRRHKATSFAERPVFARREFEL